MKSNEKQLPMPINTFRQLPRPKKPTSRCVPASRAEHKPLQPSYDEQRTHGKTRVIDFPADPILFDSSISEPYSKDVIHLVKGWIIESFRVQLVLFVLKLLCLAVAVGAIALVYLGGKDATIVAIIGGAAAVICIVMSVFVFYYVGVVSARRQLQLQRGFVVFMGCNYVLSLVALAGFAYFALREVVNDDLGFSSDYKSAIDLGFLGAVLLYFLLGCTISVLAMGVIVHLLRLLQYALIFLYKIFTMKLFANLAQRKANRRIVPQQSPHVSRSQRPEYECEAKQDEESGTAGGTRADEKSSPELAGTQNRLAMVSTQRDTNQLLGEDAPLPQQQLSSTAQISSGIHAMNVKTGLVLRPLKGVVKPYKTSMKAKECGVCGRGFQPGEKVVGLTCNSDHVFHQACLREKQPGKTERKGDCPTCSRSYFI